MINKEIPATVVYEDDLVLAFMDAMPINPGHVLVIPKQHHQFISDVDAEYASRMFEVARKINSAIRESAASGGLKCEDLNFMLSDGPSASQEVYHTHLHVIPRYAGDGVGFRFPNKPMGLLSPDKLGISAEEIKKNLKGL